MEFDQSKIETKLTEEIMLIFSELGKDKVNEIIKLNTRDYNMVYSYVHKVVMNNIKELEEEKTTELIIEKEDYYGCLTNITKTKCCGIAPITNENFCPNCGHKIIRK